MKVNLKKKLEVSSLSNGVENLNAFN